MTASGSIGSGMSERLIFALLLSIGLHAAVLFAIRAKPIDSGSAGSAPIVARLERSLAAEEPPAAVREPEVHAAATTEVAPPEPIPEAIAPSPAAKEQAPVPPAPNQAAAEARPALEVPLIRDPTYYAARFLDEYPRPLSPVEPRYPENASRDNIGGKVTLLLLIDETGTLNEISVVDAKPAEIFDQAALAAFRDMRFSPARKGGRAVRSRVLITVGFESGNNAALK